MYVQTDEVSAVTVIEAILQTDKGLNKLKATFLKSYSAFKKVLSRIVHNESLSTYQGADLTKFSDVLSLKVKHNPFLI